MKWLLRAALWSAFGHALITACSDAAILEPREQGDDDGTGGAGRGGDDPSPGSSGGRSAGGGKSSPPSTGTGGRFGAGGSPFPGAGGSPIPPPKPCGPVVWTPEAYCRAYPGSCNLSSQTCVGSQVSIKQIVDQGCGYIRFTYYEDSGSSYGRVYDQSTQRLVHYWVAGVQSECGNVTEVGSMPGCSGWVGIPCGSWLPRDAGPAPADAPAE